MYALEESLIWLGVLPLATVPGIMGYAIARWRSSSRRNRFLGWLIPSLAPCIFFAICWIVAQRNFESAGYDDGSSSMAGVVFIIVLAGNAVAGLSVMLIGGWLNARKAAHQERE